MIGRGNGRSCAQEGGYMYRSSRSLVSLDIIPNIGLGVSHI